MKEHLPSTQSLTLKRYRTIGLINETTSYTKMFIFYLQGMKYFISRGLLKDNPYEIARFLDGTSSLHKTKVRQYLQARQDVVEYLVSFQNYFDAFLPNALRRFFSKLEAPNDRGSYLQVRFLDQWSKKQSF